MTGKFNLSDITNKYGHSYFLLKDVFAEDIVQALSDVITVPVIPLSLQPKLLHQTHDEPSAGHQGFDKTLNRLQQQAYWVGMASDVNKYCRECLKCQQMKQSLLSKAPLTSIPVGRPWEMIAVDVLQVPMSYQHN